MRQVDDKRVLVSSVKEILAGLREAFRFCLRSTYGGRHAGGSFYKGGRGPDMNVKRWVIASVAVAVVIAVLETIIHGVLL